MRKRHPLLKIINNAIWDLPTPSNLNIWWTFGSLLGLCLVLQIVTGIFLAMHYTPDTSSAFHSVNIIVRDVNYGWLLRNIHANGASLFFACIYIHIGRGIYFGSYNNKTTWFIGVTLFLLTIVTAFLGYVLPWGQMSFAATTVITSLLTAIPYVGQDITQWIWGGSTINNCTLHRFFVFHFLLPFLLVILTVIHLVYLHESGTHNPLGFKSLVNHVPFHPYLTSKDLTSAVATSLVLVIFVFFLPQYLSDPENYNPVNPLATPAHIQPEWYFLFIYAILRAIPNKLGGLMIAMAAIFILLLLPSLHTSKQSSNTYRPFGQISFWLFIGNFFLLTWIGSQPVEYPFIYLGQITTTIYFLIPLFIFPLLGIMENEVNKLNLNIA
uniref:Cytochrome b n=1 Tax=Aspidophiura sp. TaxID=3135528 RepID=A0AAU6QCH4_9ECHI